MKPPPGVFTEYEEAVIARWEKYRRAIGGVAHGTHSSYSQGCRCAACLEGERVFMRDYMRNRRATDPAFRDRINARQRERLATDPAFRDRHNAQRRERRATDPAFRERDNARQRERRAIDPELHRSSCRNYRLRKKAGAA